MTGMIDRAFAGYLKAAALEHASAEQVRELRQAFFGGAAVTFSTMVDKAADWRVLEALQREIHEFGAELDERCKHTMTFEDGQSRAGFKDLADLPEDERINQIGTHVRAGNVVGVMLERSDPLKVERYVKKVTERFPGVRLVRKEPNPSGKLVVLQFGPATNG